MARRFVFFILFCVFLTVRGQMEPQFSQNMFNLLTVNPGFAGSSDMLNFSALSRMQYVGLSQAPKTTVFAVDAAVEPLGLYSGIGANLMIDEIGLYSVSQFNFCYANRFDLKEGTIGFGISVGLIDVVFDASKLDVDFKDSEEYAAMAEELKAFYSEVETSSLYPSAKIEGNTFDMGLGVYYSNEKYYIGLSALHLLKPKPKFKEDFNFYYRRSFFITGGYTFPLRGTPIILKPSLFIKSDGLISQYDINLLMEYKKKYWGGLSVRYQDAIVFMGGVEMNNGIRLGYALDIPVSRLAGFFSHEVSVGYNFDLSFDKKKKGYKSVRYL